MKKYMCVRFNNRFQVFPYDWELIKLLIDRGTFEGMCFIRANSFDEAEQRLLTVKPDDDQQDHILPTLNLVELEHMAVIQALDENRQIQRRAAKVLGIHENTLYSKIQKHEIDVMKYTRHSGPHKWNCINNKEDERIMTRISR